MLNNNKLESICAEAIADAITEDVQEAIKRAVATELNGESLRKKISRKVSAEINKQAKEYVQAELTQKCTKAIDLCAKQAAIDTINKTFGGEKHGANNMTRHVHELLQKEITQQVQRITNDASRIGFNIS